MRWQRLAALVVAALALSNTPAATAAATAAATNYGDFSRMFSRSAGQYWSSGTVAGQWAWEPQSPTVSHIRWGDPAAWPPATYERFERSGDWVYLIGYGDSTTGQFLPQVVTEEWIGDQFCRNLQPLPVDGKQHYAKWAIPSTSYCLLARGFVDWQGTRIDFEHRQVWFPPSGPTCKNTYLTGRVCVKQYERYADNNGNQGGPLIERQRRDHIFAKGLGPAFIVHDWRTGWEAHGCCYWTYPGGGQS